MSHLKIRRTVAALSLSALAVGGLAACGDDGDSGSSNGGSSSSEAGSSDGEEGGSDEGAASGESMFGVAEGEEVDPTEFADANAEALASIESAAIEITTTTGDTEVTMEGVSTFDPENLNMQIESDEAGEIRVVDGVMYLPQGPGSDQYFSLDLSDPSNPLGATFGAIADPEASAQAYSTAATSITYSGTTDVDGTDAESYDVTLDAAAFYESLGLADFAALIDQGALPPEFTQVVAFDDEGRVVLVEQLVPETAQVPETKTRTTYSDFGVEVDVEAPDPADVTPYAEAFAGQA